ncbi:hypothetical protein PT974_05949 [Cladobotryum mycophilum]|uniref:Uncharacterized protein n=1 Tax=Cladobotryum mycophilum TaxID=491253 RepID=A0ABR0SK83_9HYPO
MSMFAISHQRAKSGDMANRHKVNKLSISSDVSVTEKHKRSLSWLAPHRRKDSGISISTRSTRSFRISSLAPTTPIISSAQSSSSSRLSYESDRTSNSSKAASSPNSEATAVSELSDGPRSPALPPKRPDRPQEGLFECAIVDEVDEEVENGNMPVPENQTQRQSRELLGDRPGPSRTPSSDVHQLMREADLAYEAVGAALLEARNRSSFASAVSDTLAPPPIVPVRRRPHQKALSETMSSADLSRKASTASSASKNDSLNQSMTEVTRKPSRSSRWTLTESMADMFKSQKAPRPKADRKAMTPARIEAIWNGQDINKSSKRKEKEKERQHKKKKSLSDNPMLAEFIQSQAVANHGETLRLEPFHRPDAPPSPAFEPTGPRPRAVPFEIVIPPSSKSVLYNHNVIQPETPPPQQSIPSEPEETKEEANDAIKAESEEAILEAEPEVQNDEEDSEPSIFLIPPPKNPARFAARAPTMPQLPPIPEGFRPQQPENKHLSKSSFHHRSRSLSQVGVETDECVYFRSTPFTLTNPAFRHGPIIFQKSEINRDSLVAESVEEDVDWAAFQTAIMGGAGDLDEIFPEEKVEAEAEAEDDESNIADEVTAWFEEFGFETHGELIVSEKIPERNPDRSSRDSAGSLGSAASTPSTINTEEELRTPVDGQQHHHVFDTIKLLRDRCSSMYSVSIYESTVDLPLTAFAEEETMNMKPNMEQGLDHFLRMEAEHAFN